MTASSGRSRIGPTIGDGPDDHSGTAATPSMSHWRLSGIGIAAVSARKAAARTAARRKRPCRRRWAIPQAAASAAKHAAIIANRAGARPAENPGTYVYSHAYGAGTGSAHPRQVTMG